MFASIPALSLLTADVVLAALACPLAGVLATSRRAVVMTVSAFVVGVLVSGVLLAASGLTTGDVLAVHAVLIAASLAFAAIGRVCRASLTDPLDAIAVSLCLSLSVSFGIFAIGRAAAELSPGTLEMVLTTSPLVAAAAAAQIDLFRTDLLYRISPMAHMFFDYPAWERSAIWFTAVAATCALWVRMRERGAVRRHGR